MKIRKTWRTEAMLLWPLRKEGHLRAVYTCKRGGKFNRNLIINYSFSTPPYHHITMHHNTYSAWWWWWNALVSTCDVKCCVRLALSWSEDRAAGCTWSSGAVATRHHCHYYVSPLHTDNWHQWSIFQISETGSSNTQRHVSLSRDGGEQYSD